MKVTTLQSHPQAGPRRLGHQKRKDAICSGACQVQQAIFPCAAVQHTDRYWQADEGRGLASLR